jgi:hypothetical protein
MQENVNLIREILLEIEKEPLNERWRNIAVQRHSREELCYQAHLASDAGLIEAKFFQNSSSEFLVRRLTKEGRSFLDVAREGTYNRQM